MPDYFYKYRSIENAKDLKAEHSLDALFNNYAIFSNRKNFNDLFDSKVSFIKPNHKQIKALKNNLQGDDFLIFSEFISKGRFTPKYSEFVKNMESSINEVLDGYIFYCVSKNPLSNLMWSHYASSHYGFCIEFKADLLPASEVTYQKYIPSINFIDLVKLPLDVKDNKGLNTKVWTALRTKLDEWAYEEEYRLQANNELQKMAFEENDKFTKISYPREFVKSIIFGCRMTEETRNYIIKKMPSDTKFKEIKVKDSSIKMVDCK